MTHASLFSGIGGPEVAAAMLGWDNLFHCEINPFGRNVLDYWFPESESYEDITKTDFTKWRGRIDVLTGGFPCQPFSYAGKRGGREDERYLWPQMLRAIDEIRPTWVVGENVAGLSTMVEGWVLTEIGSGSSLFEEDKPFHDWLLEQTFTIDKIAKELEDLGYSIQPVLIPAAAVGAPHRRDRIFILAHNDAENAVGDGRGCGPNEEQGSERIERHALAGDPERLRAKAGADPSDRGDAGAESVRGGEAEIHSAGSAPDTDRRGRREVHAEIQRELADGDGALRAGSERNAADTDRERLATTLQSGGYGAQERNGAGRSVVMFTDHAWLEGAWWDNFPTVSPVHAGNDGIPIRLDGITLPAAMQPRNYRNSDRQRFNFGRWRTESIKAYGNAIVPQVMYRIFQAIESAITE